MRNGNRGFTEAARIAGLKARKRNAKLRREGKLPPIKRKGQGESIPLDSPMFDPVPKRKYVKPGQVVRGEGNREIVLRLLALIERLV